MSGLSQPLASVDAAPTAPPVRPRRLNRSRAADLGFVVVLVVAFLYIVREGHGNRFFFDEWGWIDNRRNGLSTILDSYNQHMEIVPLAVYQLMLHTIGLDHYRWYRLLADVGHLTLVTAIYCFARRRIGPLALALVIPLACFGAGWEFILWGVNFGFTTSLGLGVFALVWLDADRRPALGGCLLLTASLMFSETAVLFAIGLAVELTWRDRGLRRAWVWAVPIIIYVAWHVGFYASTGTQGSIGAIPTFGAQLAAGAAGGMFGLGDGLGWVVLGLIVILLGFRLARCGALSPRLVAVLLTVLGYWTLVSVSRAQLGTPTASRYVYTGAVLLLLVLLESLRDLRINRPTALACGGLALLALIGNLIAFHGGELQLNEGSTSEAAELTGVELMRGFIPPGRAIDPHWSPMIMPAAYFAATRDLHSTGAVTLAQLVQEPEEPRVSTDLVLVRGGDLTVARLPTPDPGTAAARAPRVELVLGGRLTRTPGCVHFDPSGYGSTLDLTLPGGGLSVHIDADAASLRHPPTDIRVRRFADGYYNDPVISTRHTGSFAITARRDAAPQPWHVRISPWSAITACTVGG